MKRQILLKSMLCLLMALVCHVAWAQTSTYFEMGASTTSLVDGNYVLVAMSDKGTGPVIYEPTAGEGKHYRYEAGKTMAAGDIVPSNYVWTIDETTVDGVQHITVTYYDDNTKAFPVDVAHNENFTGSGVASLKTEVKTINGVDYIALTLDNAEIGYIHVNKPNGNPCLSYWPEYGDEGTCIKFTFYPVNALEESEPVVVTTPTQDKFYTLQCKATDHDGFINDNGTSVNGRSSEGSFFVFERGEEDNTYYIKSDASGKYINANGNAITVDTENKTAWVLNAPSHSAGWVTFEDGTSKNFLNNNYTAAAPYLKANYHDAGPGSGNACSLWQLTEYTTLGKLLEQWKRSVLPYLGYVGGYPADLRDEIEAVVTIAEKEAFVAEHEALAINADTYYRLVCVAPKTGNNGDTSYNTLTFDGQDNLVTRPTDEEDCNQLFRFEDAGNGKYYLKSITANAYLNKIAAGNYRSKVVDKDDACKLTASIYDGTVIQWRFHNSESVSGTNHDKHCLFAENHPSETVPYACAGWDKGANSASAWKIVPVTGLAHVLNVTSAGYATLYLDCAVAIPSDIEVYIAQSIAKGEDCDRLMMAQVTGVLPANTGVIVKAKAGRYSLMKSDDEPSVDVTGNMLKGTTTSKYIDAIPGHEYYVLSNKEGIGMYRPTLNGNRQFKNNAYKAYLEINSNNRLGFQEGESDTTAPDGQLSNKLRFDFSGTTDIEQTTDNRQQTTDIYDLLGRKVTDTEGLKGIYIVGGRKVVIK